jgi:magnesium transporter
MEAQKRQASVFNNGITWTDMQRPIYADLLELGKEHPSFNKLNFEDCLSKIQIPKIDRYEDHLFIVIHFPTPDKERGFIFSQLSIFMGANYLVTVHQGELKPIEELFSICGRDESLKQTIMGKSSGYLLHKIIDTLVDDLLHLLMKVVGNIEDIEDFVFTERSSASRQLAFLRREITTLRRIVLHVRRTVVELTKDVQRFSKEDLTPYFKDVQEHVEKVNEALEEAKETVEIYKDSDFVLSSEKTNKILAVLTIIFTLSIPATVIGAFYGMNVNIPGGLDTGPWTQLGPYTTFVFAIAISMAPAALMFIWFYRLGWLERPR